MRSLLRRPQRQIPEAAVDRPAEDLAQSLSAPDFDLAATVASGQVFRWEELSPGVFRGWIGADWVQVSQQGSRLNFQGTSVPTIKRFFSLDRDLPAIVREIDVDPVIHAALKAHWGIRLIRQEPWECLAGFILSSFNNIVRLTGMLNRLAVRFGELAALPLGVACSGRSSDPASPTSLSVGPRSPSALRPAQGLGNRARSGLRLPSQATPSGSAAPFPIKTRGDHQLAYRFPGPERLAGVSERTLRNCGLGFRAPYLKGAAQAVADGSADLEKWRVLDDEALRRQLLTIPGVGEKVVECVMLFAFGREAAFPVDVWIGRAMRAWYFKRRKVTDRQIREFAPKHFGPQCGWAQQYLYCQARLKNGLEKV